MIYHVHIVGTVYSILQKNMNILQWFSCKLGINWLPQKGLSDLLKDKEMRTEKVKNNVVSVPNPHEENQQNRSDIQNVLIKQVRAN